MDNTSAVLRNKGVKIQLAVLDADGEQILDGEEPRIEDVWIKFRASTVADLEEAFDGYKQVTIFTPSEPAHGPDGNVIVNAETGEPVMVPIPGAAPREILTSLHGINGFIAAMRDKPASVSAAVLATILKTSPEQVKARMLTTHLTDYSTSLSIAWMLSNGSDPDVLGKSLVASRESLAAQMKATSKELEARLVNEMTTAMDESPGETGSEPGPDEKIPADLGAA